MPRVGIVASGGIDDFKAGKTMLAFSQRGSIGRSSGYGNGRFGFAFLGDSRFFSGIYQRRVTGYNQTGRIPGRKRRVYYVRERSYRPTNPNSPAQQKFRSMFADAVAAWSLLTPVEKSVYNQRGIKRNRVGRNIFTSEYMKAHRFE